MSINKNGIWNEKSFSNFSIRFVTDPVVIQEPDGSVWLQVLQHIDPSTNLFNSTDTFAIGVYKDENRWAQFNIFDKCNKWEILLKQKLDSSSDELKYRWIQSVNPNLAKFDDVDAEDITKITTAGYTTSASKWGGAYIKKSSTYIVCNNSNSGNWFGAWGCWTAHMSGIPAYDANVVTDGYVKVYIRIDNNSLININKTQIFDTHDMGANNFIEI